MSKNPVDSRPGKTRTCFIFKYVFFSSQRILFYIFFNWLLILLKINYINTRIIFYFYKNIIHHIFIWFLKSTWQCTNHKEDTNPIPIFIEATGILELLSCSHPFWQFPGWAASRYICRAPKPNFWERTPFNGIALVNWHFLP